MKTTTKTVNSNGMKFFTTWESEPEQFRKQVSEAQYKALSKIGAYVRRTMQTSMRQSTATSPHSPAGTPPKYSSKFIRDQIYFKIDTSTYSVVAGPQYWQGSGNPESTPIGKTVPQLLDEGGFAQIKKHRVLKNKTTGEIVSPYSRGGMIIKKRMAKKTKSGKKWRWAWLPAGMARFEPRPFVQPALRENITKPKLESAWATIRNK